MKMKLFFLSILTIVTLSCSKESKTAIVHKNCTGSYLVIDDKMNRICNFEVLADHEEGEEVHITYEVIGSCERYDSLIICMMAFPYDQDIEVTSIE